MKKILPWTLIIIKTLKYIEKINPNQKGKPTHKERNLLKYPNIQFQTKIRIVINNSPNHTIGTSSDGSKGRNINVRELK